MLISDILHARVGLLGFGREGRATLDLLRRRGHPGEVAVFSDTALALPPGAIPYIGGAGLAAFKEIDVLIRSPGFPPHHPACQFAQALQLPQTTATHLFLAELRHNGSPVIGITGSKGKSTTSLLTQRILSQAGQPAVLVGNIGLPALDYLDDILAQHAIAVLEMSSYQCADLPSGAAPSIACLLDLFPEHLDWHGGEAEYYAAKAMIAHAQTSGDLFLCNARSAHQFAAAPPPSRMELINHVDSLHFASGWFRRGEAALFTDRDMRLLGAHNRENAVAAFAAAERHGAKPEHWQIVLSECDGLPYRLQDEGLHAGVRFINDSLSTAPQAAAAALQALGENAKTLIAGGYDRGYQPDALVQAILQSNIKHLILLPETGRAIAQAARDAGCSVHIHEVEDLDAAVALAFALTPRGGACLFSPGAPSYHQYRSFEERGQHFRRLITAHAAHE